jgi:UDP-N-acetylglucosamine:LPS N-acetylglucosamine transferase
MAVSDIVITKPGPGTINEALSMQLPVLIDNTNTPLSWEQANIDLVVRYGVGERINDYKETKEVLRKYLKDPDSQKNIQEAFSRIPPNLFQERIPQIIDSMLVKPLPRKIVDASS